MSETNWIKVSDLQPGDKFRWRGGKKDMTFHSVEKDVDGIKRDRVYVIHENGSPGSFRKHPFTKVIKLEDNTQSLNQ